jgi:hypothetical protein
MRISHSRSPSVTNVFFSASINGKFRDLTKETDCLIDWESVAKAFNIKSSETGAAYSLSILSKLLYSLKFRMDAMSLYLYREATTTTKCTDIKKTDVEAKLKNLWKVDQGQ